MFKQLAEKNLDAYEKHPTIHTIITMAYGIAAFKAIGAMAEKSAETFINRR